MTSGGRRQLGRTFIMMRSLKAGKINGNTPTNGKKIPKKLNSTLPTIVGDLPGQEQTVGGHFRAACNLTSFLFSSFPSAFFC